MDVFDTNVDMSSSESGEWRERMSSLHVEL